MNTNERLLAAIQTREVLKVAYRGGSAPGSIREIAPIKILGDKVRAHCYTSNGVKMFVISRIAILEGKAANTSTTWHPKIEQPPA